MPGGNLGELVQMITSLSGVQAQKRQLDLNQQSITNQASQFAETGAENDFTAALKLIAGSSSKTRQGLEGLVNSLAPQYKEAALAYLHGQPIAPGTLQAQDIQAGREAMAPGQLAAVQGEAATTNATGMNLGQFGQSQVGGALAAGALPQLTQQEAGAYGQRMASGQTPADAAVGQYQVSHGMIPGIAKIQGGLGMTAGQAAQVGLGYAGVNFNYAQLDQSERKMAADYGLDKMLKTAEAAKYGRGGVGGMTGQAWLDGMAKLPNILNDINKNSSDPASNAARKRVYNTLATALGQDQLVLPMQGDASPGKVGMLNQLLRGLTGMSPTIGTNSPLGAWPTAATQP